VTPSPEDQRPGSAAARPGMDATRPLAPRRVVALSVDAIMLDSLREIGGDDIEVTIVSHVDALSGELMRASGAAIALIDADALDTLLDRLVDQLSMQFPDLRLIVAGYGAEQGLLASRIADQRVFRFLHKPASAQRLRLFIDAAARPRISGKPLAPPPPSVVPDRADRRPPLLVGGIVAAVLAVGGVAAWLLGGRDEPATAAPAAQPATDPAKPQLEELIRRADAAFGARRYVSDAGDGAADLYGAALQIQASDARAAGGFERSIEFALRDAEQAFTAGRLDEVDAQLARLRRADPENPRLAFLGSQLQRERERSGSEATRRQALESTEAQLRSALARANDRLRRGSLTEPARDSALFHYRAAEALGPSDAGVRAMRDNLVTALVAQAGEDLDISRATAARRMIDAAAALDPRSPALDAMRRRLDGASPAPAAAGASPAAAPVAATPPAAGGQASAATPAPTAAAAASPSATVAVAPEAANTASGSAEENTRAGGAIPAARLPRLSAPAANYPERALEMLVSGWVEMEFTIQRDGTVRDISVVSAQPVGTFNAAAQAALRRWRFVPIQRDGRAVEQRAWLRMRFTATETDQRGR
jgi:TonB family protein